MLLLTARRLGTAEHQRDLTVRANLALNYLLLT